MRDRATFLRQVSEDIHTCASEAKAEMLAGNGYGGLLNAFVWLTKIPMLEQLHDGVKKIVFEKDLEGAEFARTLIMTTIDAEFIRSLFRAWPQLGKMPPRLVMGIDVAGVQGHMDTSALIVASLDPAKRGASIRVVSTPWHPDDLAGKIQKEQAKRREDDASEDYFERAWAAAAYFGGNSIYGKTAQTKDTRTISQMLDEQTKHLMLDEAVQEPPAHTCDPTTYCRKECPAFAHWAGQILDTAGSAKLDHIGHQYGVTRHAPGFANLRSDHSMRLIIRTHLDNDLRERAKAKTSSGQAIKAIEEPMRDRFKKALLKGLDAHDERESEMQKIARKRGVVEARYESTCPHCNKLIVPGDMIVMGPLASWLHAMCGAA